MWDYQLFQALDVKSWTALPVSMNNAQGVYADGTLYLGGGYTGNSKTDATVYAYDCTSSSWVALPPSPVKWCALSVLGNKLTLLGGRELNNPQLACYTNKIAVWNEGSWKWESSSLPSMAVPRMAPTVISHSGHLIAAGGKKGSLDHNAEVLHANSKRWVRSPSLPFKCLSHTSAVVSGVWYLMNEPTGEVQCARISTYMDLAHRQAKAEKEEEEEEGQRTADNSRENPEICCSELWKKLATNPPVSPFRIASTTSHLLALSNHVTGVTVHTYRAELWVRVAGRPPVTVSSGLLLGTDSEDGLYVVGGKNCHCYSNLTYKLILTTCKELRSRKRGRHVVLSDSDDNGGVSHF